MEGTEQIDFGSDALKLATKRLNTLAFEEQRKILELLKDKKKGLRFIEVVQGLYKDNEKDYKAMVNSRLTRLVKMGLLSKVKISHKHVEYKINRDLYDKLVKAYKLLTTIIK